MAECTAYVHADKHDMSITGEQIGLIGDTLGMFIHALAEVEIDLEVNTKTGLAKIVRVNGQELKEPTHA